MADARTLTIHDLYGEGTFKCANCKYWDALLDQPTFGMCGRYTLGGALRLTSGNPVGIGAVGWTTNLTVCSAWEAIP